MARRRTGAVNRERGFILVMVLWAIIVLSLMAAGFAAMTRAKIRTTAGHAELAAAEALADAGVNLALLSLMGSKAALPASPRFAADGETRLCVFDGGARLAIRIEDEAGKVDLNAAGEPALVALFVALGTGPETARSYAQRILDYRDGDREPRADGAEEAAYLAVGRLKPKNAPFDTVEELEQVLGLPAEIARGARSYLTVTSRLNGIDPEKAADLLKSAAGPGLPRVRSEARAFAIHALARMPSGVQYATMAVAEFPELRGRNYVIRQWHHSEAWQVPEFEETDAAELPPC